ncbi:MAG: Cof-type HAD-IIB family hydrolase [Thermovenabulum sp.]|uniref:Cof-type HAD-IIB family hydrolase n=1 Tax=Thermovenabulum sp. TaxID=3100335 RepID=UPI003C79F04D
MEGYKLIALDVDGTLINSRYILTKRTIKALRQVMNKGLYVTLCTGRFYRSAIRIAKNIPVNAPIITSDGALIRDVYNNRIYYEKALQKDVLMEIIDTVSGCDDVKLQIFLRDKKIFLGKSYRVAQLKRFYTFARRFSFIGSVNYIRDFVLIPVKNIDDVNRLKKYVDRIYIDGYMKESLGLPLKAVISGNPVTIVELTKKFEKMFGKSIYITSAVKNTVDIVDGEVSKAKGLEVISRILGLKRQDIIAIGDNYNDILMLEYAGLGVLMGNAPLELKEKGLPLTLTNNEEGVAYFIESHFKNTFFSHFQ